MLYNANVDRAPAHRRTLDQLRHDLRKAEEAEQKTRKETVDDPVAYQVRPPPSPSDFSIRLTIGMCVRGTESEQGGVCEAHGGGETKEEDYFDSRNSDSITDTGRRRRRQHSGRWCGASTNCRECY